MKLILDIWASFRRLPLWVQIWVALILVPVNMAALAFVGHPKGFWIAVLAVGGMTPNLFILLYERGFSKAMALPHLLIWTPMLVYIAILTARGDVGSLDAFLVVLVTVDVISLVFDFPDAWKWWKGDRQVA